MPINTGKLYAASGHRGGGAVGANEAEAREARSITAETMTLEETRRVLHELWLHQEELENQNRELLQTQLALETSRERYFNLYDMAPAGYLTLAPGGHITEANLRAATMLDVDRAQLVTRPITDFVTPGSQGQFHLARRQQLKSRAHHAVELRMHTQSKEPFWARLEIDSQGAGDGQWLALSNISEQRELQAQLAQANRLSGMGLLAAGIAHEINNPLTYILGNLELIAEQIPVLKQMGKRLGPGGDHGPQAGAPAVRASELRSMCALADDLTEMAIDCADGASSIGRITSALNGFARPDSEEVAPTDVNKAFEMALTVARKRVSSSARLRVSFTDVPPVLGSNTRLSQVFLNLLLNAADATEGGSVDKNLIEVRTWVEGTNVFGQVSDNGSGISAEDLESVFEPFFTTKSCERGMGLGLAISKRIAHDLGGSLRLESELGQGTRATLCLPVVVAADATPPSAMPQGMAQSCGRVLVVDDQDLVLDMTAKQLAKDHDVVKALSGKAAQEQVMASPNFDVIVCDLMMPEMKGTEFHAWLAREFPALATRVLFTTGGIFDEDVSRYLQPLPNQQLSKPYTVAELRRVVAEHVMAVRRKSGSDVM